MFNKSLNFLINPKEMRFYSQNYQFSMPDCTRLHIVQLSSVHRHRKTGHTLWLHTRMSLKPGKRVWWWKGDIWALRLTVCPPPSHLWPWNSKPCWRNPSFIIMCTEGRTHSLKPWTWSSQTSIRAGCSLLSLIHLNFRNSVTESNFPSRLVSSRSSAEDH